MVVGYPLRMDGKKGQSTLPFLLPPLTRPTGHACWDVEEFVEEMQQCPALGEAIAIRQLLSCACLCLKTYFR